MIKKLLDYLSSLLTPPPPEPVEAPQEKPGPIDYVVENMDEDYVGDDYLRRRADAALAAALDRPIVRRSPYTLPKSGHGAAIQQHRWDWVKIEVESKTNYLILEGKKDGKMGCQKQPHVSHIPERHKKKGRELRYVPEKNE